MKRSPLKSGRGSIAMGGLTPLLDTIFLLLFALLALSDAKSSSREEPVRILLPAVEPDEGAAAPASQELALEIDSEGAIRWLATGSLLETRDELDLVLADTVGESLPEEVAIEIRADRDAPYGVAVEVLQHLRTRGFANVQLLALAEPDSPGATGAKGAFGGAE